MAQSDKNLLSWQTENATVQGKMTHEDDDILSILRERGDPAYATSEVADLTGMTTEGIRNRLEDLAAEGRLVRKDASRQCTLWWLPKYDDINAVPPDSDDPHR